MPRSLAPWFAVWLVSNPLSGLLSVREWQGSALAFAAFEFALRLGALLIGTSRGSPMLAVALLSASGVVISVASIARFMHAGPQLDRPARRSGRPAGRAGRRCASSLRPPRSTPGTSGWRSSPARWRSPRTTSSCSARPPPRACSISVPPPALRAPRREDRVRHPAAAVRRGRDLRRARGRGAARRRSRGADRAAALTGCGGARQRRRAPAADARPAARRRRRRRGGGRAGTLAAAARRARSGASGGPGPAAARSPMRWRPRRASGSRGSRASGARTTSTPTGRTSPPRSPWGRAP